MILELKNIDKSFGEKEVLKGVSFTAEGGKAFGLLGRNGAGKTTSIRILMNVFPANSGEVLIDGKPIDYDKIGIGYLPEERGLYPKKLIIDQLVYFAELKGMSARDAVRSVDPREGKRHTAAAAREESARACPDSRRGLTPLDILFFPPQTLR